MSKKRKAADTNQLNLFDIIKNLDAARKETRTEAGAFNIKPRLKALMSEDLKHCPISRELVAGKMSELVGEDISKTTLDTWTAESKEGHRFPAAYLPAFMKATGSREILRVMAEMAGGYFIEGEDALYTELGRVEQMRKDLDKKENLIRQTLDQMGMKQ